MKYFFNFILFSFIGLLSLCTPIYADDIDDNNDGGSAAADSTGRDDTQVYHVYDGVDLISVIKIEYGKPRIVVKAVYPQLESGGMSAGIDGFNKAVLDIVQEEVSAYTEKVVENKSAQQQLPKEKIKNDLYIDYATAAMRSGKNHILSIRFSIQDNIAGMAHPTHHHRVLNYDLDENEKIELPDLFIPNADYLDVLSNYTGSALFRRLPNKRMVSEGTQPMPENFKIWNVKSNGLLITFEETQVAPYINGAQTVLVPYSVLKNIMAADSPIIACVNNRKRCGYNNLLTGGFIDEAIKKPIINDKVLPKVNVAVADNRHL